MKIKVLGCKVIGVKVLMLGLKIALRAIKVTFK